MNKRNCYLLFCCTFILIIGLNSVLALEDQELLYCDSQNMTLGNCLSFWIEIKGIIGNYTCPECVLTNCTNNTVTEYVNQTVYLEKNCSSEFEWFKYEKEVELEKMRIQNNCTTQVEGITQEDCDKQCEESVKTVKEQCDNSNTSSDKNDADYFTYILIGVIILLCFLAYNNFKKNKSGNSFPSPSNDFFNPNLNSYGGENAKKTDPTHKEGF